MKFEEILHRCFRCGYCKLPSNYVDLNCPSYLAYGFETYSPGGRMWLIRAWLDGKIDSSGNFGRILFSCATCANCVEHCAMPGFSDDILFAFRAAKEELLDSGRVPSQVSDYLTRVQRYGNPYAKPASKRADWARDAGIDEYDGHEYLFFAGDTGSYDPRGQEIAASVANLLLRAGISMGVLPANENSDGNDVRAAGETPLADELCKKNIEAFKKKGVKKIITLSPHAFNTFKKDYPDFGGVFSVFHYTQILAFNMGALKVGKQAPPLTITFHDPCYLGRHGGDFQSPRMILGNLPGIQIIEMDRNRKNALCCGGGGGNFFTDMFGDADVSPARYRVREAAETGASVLAVACPLCAVMLEDAVKTEGLEGKLRVREISEIVRERLNGK